MRRPLAPLHPALLLVPVLLAGGCFALGWDDYKEAPAGSGGSGGSGGEPGAGGAGGDTTTTTTTTSGGGGGGGVPELPTPVVIAAGESSPRFVEVDAEYIYWCNQNAGNGLRGIRRLAKAGGDPVSLAAGGDREPWAIALSDSHVYWVEILNGVDCATDPAKDRVMRVSKAGDAPPEELWAGCGGPRGVALDGLSVYWTQNGDDRVMRMPQPTGAATAIATGQAGALGIVLDGETVYWANTDGNVIGRFQKSSGAVDAFAATLGPTRMAIDATAVYWINPTGVFALPKGMAGASPTTLAQAQTELRGLAVDEAFVYFTDLTTGEVQRVPKGGGGGVDPVVIAEGQSGPTGITVDGDAVYWANELGGEIVMQKKP